jgi:hypothetical protein
MPSDIYQGIVHTRALARLPSLYKIMGLQGIENLSGNLCTAMVVLYRDDTDQLRTSYFDATSGEYLGEYVA